MLSTLYSCKRLFQGGFGYERRNGVNEFSPETEPGKVILKKKRGFQHTFKAKGQSTVRKVYSTRRCILLQKMESKFVLGKYCLFRLGPEKYPNNQFEHFPSSVLDTLGFCLHQPQHKTCSFCACEILSKSLEVRERIDSWSKVILNIDVAVLPSHSNHDESFQHTIVISAEEKKRMAIREVPNLMRGKWPHDEWKQSILAARCRIVVHMIESSFRLWVFTVMDSTSLPVEPRVLRHTCVRLLPSCLFLTDRQVDRGQRTLVGVWVW